MGYSPFKMKYSGEGRGVPALMKALVGNQDRLPEKLKQAILDAPETPKKKTSKKDAPVRSYGSKKKSPMMKTDPTKKGRTTKAVKETAEKFQTRFVKKGTGVGTGVPAEYTDRAEESKYAERRAASFKKQGVKARDAKKETENERSRRLLKEQAAKKKAPVKSYGSKKKSPVMMKGVKGLKNQRGKK